MRFGSIAIARLAWLLLPVQGFSWAQDCSHREQNLEGLTISQVIIDNRDIFDLSLDEQNLWIHKFANKYHIKTRKETIESQLLFKPQQPYSEQLIKETERLIRSRGYINDVRIESEQKCGEGVMLTVVTTDNWTLTPSLSVSHSGGETRTSFEIEESNLLGLGTEVSIKSKSNEDRDAEAITFRDSNWLGNFKILNLEFSDNSDGHIYHAELIRPFIQLDSSYAWSLDLLSHELENPIYEKSEIVGKVGEKNELAEVTYGWSHGLLGGKVSRFRLGLSANERRFQAGFPAAEIPESRTTNYPFFEYEYLKIRFLEKSNFLVMGVTEDIRLGTSLSYRIGWKDEALGSTQEGSVFSLNYNFGKFLSEQTIGLYDLLLKHETNSTLKDTARLKFVARFYRYSDQDHSYLFRSSFETALNPELFEQFVLGGDSGLRGYPIRYQNGSRKVALSLEKRVYFDWYPWQLFKFGAAVFAEAGSAWKSGEDPNFISDIGIGFRLVSTRQSASKVLHVDIAFPLSERDQVDDYQFFVKAKGEF